METLRNLVVLMVVGLIASVGFGDTIPINSWKDFHPGGNTVTQDLQMVAGQNVMVQDELGNLTVAGVDGSYVGLFFFADTGTDIFNCGGALNSWNGYVEGAEGRLFGNYEDDILLTASGDNKPDFAIAVVSPSDVDLAVAGGIFGQITAEGIWDLSYPDFQIYTSDWSVVPDADGHILFEGTENIKSMPAWGSGNGSGLTYLPMPDITLVNDVPEPASASLLVLGSVSFIIRKKR